MRRKEVGALVYLVGLLLFLFVPIFVPKAWSLLLLSVGITAFAALFDYYQKRVWLLKLALLAALAVLTIYHEYQPAAGYLVAVSYLLILAIFAVNISQMLGRLLRTTNPSAGFVVAGVNGYILLGYFFAILCAFCEFLSPGSFKAATPVEHQDLHTFVYYAFVTFATLGYGDMLPVSAWAKSLSVIVGISGTFYITLAIGLLLGKYAQANQ
jgi:hypothetical protein